MSLHLTYTCMRAESRVSRENPQTLHKEIAQPRYGYLAVRQPHLSLSLVGIYCPLLRGYPHTCFFRKDRYTIYTFIGAHTSTTNTKHTKYILYSIQVIVYRKTLCIIVFWKSPQQKCVLLGTLPKNNDRRRDSEANDTSCP